MIRKTILAALVATTAFLAVSPSYAIPSDACSLDRTKCR